MTIRLFVFVTLILLGDFYVHILYCICTIHFILHQCTNKYIVYSKEIPAEKQPKVFRTINVLITILLVSSYIEVSFT